MLRCDRKQQNYIKQYPSINKIFKKISKCATVPSLWNIRCSPVIEDTHAVIPSSLPGPSHTSHILCFRQTGQLLGPRYSVGFLASYPARQTLFSSGWLIPEDIYLLTPLFMLFLLSPSIYKTCLFLLWAPRRLHLSLELLRYLTLGGNSGRFYFGGSKVTAVTAAAKLKDICSLEEKPW